MPTAKIKKNDTVVILCGKDRGSRGRVLRVMPSESRILVEGVGIIKRHTKPNPQKNIQGGVVERESPIHISNVALLDPETDKPTRLGSKALADGRRVRVSRRSGGVLDK